VQPVGQEPVGQQPEEIETPEVEQPRVRTYRVRSGDRLYNIAQAHYGQDKGHRWTRIRDANPGIDPGRLRIGDELTIPPLENATVRLAVADQPAVEAPREEAPASTGDRTHKVAAGETLGHISTTYYGTCRKWQLIVDANPGIDPRRLRVGTRLVIPAQNSRLAEEAETQQTVRQALREVQRFAEDTAARSPHSTYTVATGDTLWSISQRHLGDSALWKTIYELNRDKLASPEAVRVGQVIRLPATTATAMRDSGVDGVR
jgi:nucleoid-associated protein YgaU